MKKRFYIIQIFSFLMTFLLLTGSAHHTLAQNFTNWTTNNTVDSYEKEGNEVESISNAELTAKPDNLTPNQNLSIEPPAEQILKDALDAPESSRYTLGVNDVLAITVTRHPEVSGEYPINSEGKIQYEFVGDLKVMGLTKDEVKILVTGSLLKFIVSPDVTVKIAGYNSKVVYVIGEVGAPGKIFMHGDTITVHEALLQAGLPLLSASTKKCRLITPAENGKPEQKYVNVEALLYEGDLRENLVMKPGDTLYIPATIMAKAMRVINPVAQPVGTAVGTGRTVYPGF